MRNFLTPEAVLEDASLTTPKKVDLLRQWDYDEREVSVALEEGMAGPEPVLLGRIVDALKVLLVDIDLEHGPPTKQCGSSSQSGAKAPVTEGSSS